MANPHEGPLRLRGGPRSVRGFVALPYREIVAMPHVLFEGAIPHAEPLAVQTVPLGEHTELRLRLPESTAPGQYRGMLRLGDRHIAVVAEVEGRTRLACVPPRIELASGSERRLRETLIIANVGNLAATLQKHYGFGLFESHGLDRAIGRAFETHGKEGRASADAFAAAVADEYGGVVMASVSEGAGPLEPGESRSVTFAFRLSEKARHGASYFGYLPIANLNIPFLVRNEDRVATEAAP